MKTVIMFVLLGIVFHSCCSPKSSEGIPILSGNFRGYVGSAPEFFLLNCWYEHQILGEIFGNPDSVIVKENSLTIGDGNRVGLVCKGINSMDADFYIRIPYGEGVRFYFRSAGVDFENSPKLVFDFTTKGSKLFEGKELIVSVDSVKLQLENQQRIFLQNEGSIVHVIVGIDTVYQGRTKLPLSEYIYVEPINSRVIIEDAYFYPLYETKFY
ncbi:MAG: hypothetical protein N2517_03640 [Ignavibacteria bacterium]|nr:hypothetical protein [Ignavibacteria bacterium]